MTTTYLSSRRQLIINPDDEPIMLFDLDSGELITINGIRMENFNGLFASISFMSNVLIISYYAEKYDTLMHIYIHAQDNTYTNLSRPTHFDLATIESYIPLIVFNNGDELWRCDIDQLDLIIIDRDLINTRDSIDTKGKRRIRLKDTNGNNIYCKRVYHSLVSSRERGNKITNTSIANKPIANKSITRLENAKTRETIESLPRAKKILHRFIGKSFDDKCFTIFNIMNDFSIVREKSNDISLVVKNEIKPSSIINGDNGKSDYKNKRKKSIYRINIPTSSTEINYINTIINKLSYSHKLFQIRPLMDIVMDYSVQYPDECNWINPILL